MATLVKCKNPVLQSALENLSPGAKDTLLGLLRDQQFATAQRYLKFQAGTLEIQQTSRNERRQAFNVITSTLGEEDGMELMDAIRPQCQRCGCKTKFKGASQLMRNPEAISTCWGCKECEKSINIQLCLLKSPSDS